LGKIYLLSIPKWSTTMVKYLLVIFKHHRKTIHQ